MKKLIIFLYFFVFYVTNVVANEINKKLNKLFDDLLVSTNVTSLEIEQKIWKLWSTHPNDNSLTLMLEKGSDAVNNDDIDITLTYGGKDNYAHWDYTTNGISNGYRGNAAQNTETSDRYEENFFEQN